jgi:hypothetical protein
MKLSIYVTATEPISVSYFINLSHQSVCLYVYPRISLLGDGSVDIFPGQSLHAKIEELLEVPSMWSVSHQTK